MPLADFTTVRRAIAQRRHEWLAEMERHRGKFADPAGARPHRVPNAHWQQRHPGLQRELGGPAVTGQQAVGQTGRGALGKDPDRGAGGEAVPRQFVGRAVGAKPGPETVQERGSGRLAVYRDDLGDPEHGGQPGHEQEIPVREEVKRPAAAQGHQQRRHDQCLEFRGVIQGKDDRSGLERRHRILDAADEVAAQPERRPDEPAEARAGFQMGQGQAPEANHRGSPRSVVGRKAEGGWGAGEFHGGFASQTGPIAWRSFVGNEKGPLRPLPGRAFRIGRGPAAGFTPART